ncbi:MAG: aminotransferase class V-fold PLP-dependent enzyme [Proteobacteria bacterium]|nr:aminotransferase class V-fold PLP-dependent enzyme [Pseudomonadota bacterium]
MNYDLETIRSQFPALALTDKGQPRVYLDNPAGTQVPVQVIQRMSDYLIHCNANQGGTFKTSIESDLILEEAHQAMADLLNAGSSSEIIFGANMTTLTYAISRSLGKRFQKGGALLLTRMDHDGNVAPWLQLAEDLGLEVRWLEFDLETYEYKLEMLENLLEPGDVLLAAVNYSSNCLGTINDIKTITEKVKSKGGLVYIDHQGVLWGNKELLMELEAYKVRPAGDLPPGKFETGTLCHEAMAGTLGAVEYLEWFSETINSPDKELTNRRQKILSAMNSIILYEQKLCKKLISGLQSLPGIKIRGITDPSAMDRRVPTVSFSVEGRHPDQLAKALGDKNIFVWSGHNYALEAVRVMGLLEKGGLVRVGPVHYNTEEEIEKFLEELEPIL